MSTTPPERIAFNAYREALIKSLGRKALDDQTLDRAGRELFKDAWGGVFPVDRVKLQPYKYTIINTDPHDKSGEHWLACYCTAKRAYVWDSYSRPIHKIAPLLIKTIHTSKMTLGKTDQIKQHEQIGFTSEVCGVLCLAFLLVAMQYGITRARNI